MNPGGGTIAAKKQRTEDAQELMAKFLDSYFVTMNDPTFRSQARRALESNLESNVELLKSLEGLAVEMASRRELPKEKVLAASVRAQMMIGWDYYEKLTRLNAEFADRLLSSIRDDLKRE